MKFSPIAIDPNQRSCSDCSVRRLSVCALLDKDEISEIAHLVRHIQFAAYETVFAQA
jgi:hypothetical protein